MEWGRPEFLPTKERPFYAAIFDVSMSISGVPSVLGFREHFGEQKRVFFDTLRPLRHVGIRAPQQAHCRFAAGLTPTSAMTARLAWRSL